MEGTDNTFTETTCECLTFATFLEESPLKEFALISIDAEGLDLTILEQIDLNAVKCEMLIVEFNGSGLSKFNDYVIPQGFRLHAKNLEKPNLRKMKLSILIATIAERKKQFAALILFLKLQHQFNDRLSSEDVEILSLCDNKK